MKILTLIASMMAAGTMAGMAQSPDASLLNLLNTTGSAVNTEDDDDDDDELSLLNLLTGEVETSDSVAATKTLKFLSPTELPVIAFMPVVFDGIEHVETVPLTNAEPYLSSGSEGLDYWLSLKNGSRNYRQLKQTYMVYNMPSVKYNINTLPKPPAKYEAVVNPESHKITFIDIKSDVTTAQTESKEVVVERRNWLHQFSSILQFSQAYVSKNWYQGGNNNVNVLGNITWNVQLNQKFHPKYILEATTQYKLGVTSTQNDKVHDFLINQDQFQFNATAGVHAFSRWYYSMTTLFKTQLFKYYPANSRTLQTAFMTPGEFNVGLGMTYNLTNSKSKLTFNASLAPLSYNLKTSLNRAIDPTSFGLDAGRRTQSSIGSNAELKLTWQMAWNISYTSRLYMFTDYDYGQADWENTLNLSVNKYLSTQLFWHLRYDSSQPSRGGWHKWQFKEVLSFGLQYQFKSY